MKRTEMANLRNDSKGGFEPGLTGGKVDIFSNPVAHLPLILLPGLSPSYGVAGMVLNIILPLCPFHNSFTLVFPPDVLSYCPSISSYWWF